MKLFTSLGIRLSSVASIASIADGVLEWCVEIPKLNNSDVGMFIIDHHFINQILFRQGAHLDDYKKICIDGEQNCEYKHWKIPTAGYEHTDIGEWRQHDKSRLNAVLSVTLHGVEGWNISEHPGMFTTYESHSHHANMAMMGYATSDYSAMKEPAHVLVWDRRSWPRVYYIDPKNIAQPFKYVDTLFQFTNDIFGIFCQYFGPWAIKSEKQNPIESGLGEIDLHLPENYFGDLIHIASNHEVNLKLLRFMTSTYLELEEERKEDVTYRQTNSKWLEYELAVRVLEWFNNHLDNKLHDGIVIATLFTFVEERMKFGLATLIPGKTNFIFVGDGAGNRNLNTAIKYEKHFNDVFIPPFYDDSGAAIGAAAISQQRHLGLWSLEWDAYRGAILDDFRPSIKWTREKCTVQELASILSDNKTIVMVLVGQSSIGPNSLGVRSILCSVSYCNNQEIFIECETLVVAERYTKTLCGHDFSDPYSSFSHKVLDPTCKEVTKIQTVTSFDNEILNTLLEFFGEITGKPMLVSFEANCPGCGTFSSLLEASQFCQSFGPNSIWDGETLYTYTGE